MRKKSLILLIVCFALIVCVFTAGAAKNDNLTRLRWTSSCPGENHNYAKTSKLELSNVGVSKRTIKCIIADLRREDFGIRAIYCVKEILRGATHQGSSLCDETINLTTINLRHAGLCDYTIELIIEDLRIAADIHDAYRCVCVAIQKLPDDYASLDYIDLRDRYLHNFANFRGEDVIDDDLSGVYFDYAYPHDINLIHFKTILDATFDPAHFSLNDQLALEAIRNLKEFYELTKNNPRSGFFDLGSGPYCRFNL